MTKIKTTDIPNRAKHLYIQLYCEKKGGKTKVNIHNAAQSWLSLSLTKKQHFYDTIATKYAVQKAQRIIKTKPYLRAKFPSNRKQKRKSTDIIGQQNNEESSSECADTDNVISSMPDQQMESENSSTSVVEENNLVDTLSELETSALEADSNAVQEREEELGLNQAQNETQLSNVKKLQDSYMSIVDEDTNSSREDNTNEGEAENVPLSEPIIPIIKNGKDLFELLKARNGINKPYESLTVREKFFYANAVRTIKKDFVKKYKEYLESLSARQLFDYYMKTFQ